MRKKSLEQTMRDLAGGVGAMMEKFRDKDEYGNQVNLMRFTHGSSFKMKGGRPTCLLNKKLKSVPQFVFPKPVKDKDYFGPPITIEMDKHIAKFKPEFCHMPFSKTLCELMDTHHDNQKLAARRRVEDFCKNLAVVQRWVKEQQG